MPEKRSFTTTPTMRLFQRWLWKVEGQQGKFVRLIAHDEVIE
jgi:hypothetical protein